MKHEAMWKALMSFLRDAMMRDQADMATLEELKDVFRAQGHFRAVHDVLAYAEEIETALAENRLSDDGEIRPVPGPE